MKFTLMKTRILALAVFCILTASRSFGVSNDTIQPSRQLNIGVTHPFIDFSNPIHQHYLIWNVTYKQGFRRNGNWRAGSAFNYDFSNSDGNVYRAFNSYSFIGIGRRFAVFKFLTIITFSDLGFHYDTSKDIVSANRANVSKEIGVGIGCGLGLQIQVAPRISLGTETAINGSTIWHQYDGDYEVDTYRYSMLSSHRFLSFTINYHF